VTKTKQSLLQITVQPP